MAKSLRSMALCAWSNTVLIAGICGSSSTAYQPAFLSSNQWRTRSPWSSPTALSMRLAKWRSSWPRANTRRLLRWRQWIDTMLVRWFPPWTAVGKLLFHTFLTVSPWRRKPMTTAATHNEQSPATAATLFVAFELSEKTWKLGFTTGHGQKPRERTITARQQEHILDEIAQ